MVSAACHRVVLHLLYPLEDVNLRHVVWHPREPNWTLRWAEKGVGRQVSSLSW